jgi:hypothetical protein
MTQSRREFLHAGVALWTASLIPTVTVAAGQPQLLESDPLAVALGYKKDAATVDTTQYPKRAGAAGATQFCNNCALYSAGADGLGSCTAIPGKLVAGKGWCNAWIPAA